MCPFVFFSLGPCRHKRNFEVLQLRSSLYMGHPPLMPQNPRMKANVGGGVEEEGEDLEVEGQKRSVMKRMKMKTNRMMMKMKRVKAKNWRTRMTI